MTSSALSSTPSAALTRCCQAPTEPSEFTFFGSYSRQLSVHLPRSELQSRFGDALRGGLYMPRTDHTTLAIIAVLAKAFQTQHNPKVSSRQLQRAFATLDTTPTEYLLQKRLASACRALKQLRATNGKTLISTIAYSVGFNDLSYFNRIFRATFNCTPGQYMGDGADSQWPCIALK